MCVYGHCAVCNKRNTSLPMGHRDKFISFKRDVYLKGSYDAISSFPFSLECYKLIVHR